MRAAAHLTTLILGSLLNGCGDPGQPSDSDIASENAPLRGTDAAALMDCARENRTTLLQAHRAGDRPGAAENSLAAINASLTDGAVFIEIDVARSSDGVLILMHDDTLERTTTGSGRTSSRSYAELSQLTLVDAEGRDTGESVPTLEAALDVLDGRGIAQIDRKRPVTFEEIAAVVEANEASDRVMIITYTLEEAIALHRRLPQVMLSTGISSAEDLAVLREAGVDLSRITAWLGLGSGNAGLDAMLARQGIETSYGDFRAERAGTIDYRAMADNGAEVISVDNVQVAAQALDALDEAGRLLQGCRLQN
jgi:glycerophosphoryl diester phosphodiesterase